MQHIEPHIELKGSLAWIAAKVKSKAKAKARSKPTKGMWLPATSTPRPEASAHRWNTLKSMFRRSGLAAQPCQFAKPFAAIHTPPFTCPYRKRRHRLL